MGLYEQSQSLARRIPLLLCAVGLSFMALLSVQGCALAPATGLPHLNPVPAQLPSTDQLEIRWRQHSFSFLLIQQMLPQQRLQVVATTLMGQQLFELNYDGQQVKVIQRVDDMKRLPFDYLLRDIMWASWPADHLKQVLAEKGYTLKEQNNERQILEHGKIILHVERINSSQLHVENKQAGYILDMTHVE